MGDDIHQLLQDARERLPADLLAVLLQLSTAEGNEASNIADDIRYSFNRERLCSAPSVIKLVAAIASERMQLRQTRVFRIFSTLAEYTKSDLPAALQKSIARELQRITPLLATVVEDREATTEARQASLAVLALFAPETPLLRERMVKHISELPDGAADVDYFEFGCAELLLSGSDAWRLLMRELAERYLADPNPSCLTPVEQMALTRHLAFLWEDPVSDHSAVRICDTLSRYGPHVVLDLYHLRDSLPRAPLQQFLVQLLRENGYAKEPSVMLIAYWLLRLACQDTRPFSNCLEASGGLWFPHGLPAPTAVDATSQPALLAIAACDYLWTKSTNLLELFPVPRSRELFGTWASNLAP